MGKKKAPPTGFISIDPSWRGTGYVVYLPEQDFIKAGCVDLVDKFSNRKKLYDTPDISRDLVYQFFAWLFEEIPETKQCTVAVLERQFKTKMQNLYHCFSNQLRCLLGAKAKIIGIASWNTKEYFGTATGSYLGNKREAIAFLLRNPELIGSELHDKNDNTADAIILLNHLLQKKYPDLMQSRRYGTNITPRANNRPSFEPAFHGDLPDSGMCCPSCGVQCGTKISGPQSKNAGREYYSCTNRQCPKSEKGGFIAWCDQPEPPKRTAGVKRAPTEVIYSDSETMEPVAKRRPPSVDDEFYTEVRAFHTKCLELMKQMLTNTQQINQGVTQSETLLQEMLEGLSNGSKNVCGTEDETNVQ